MSEYMDILSTFVVIVILLVAVAYRIHRNRKSQKEGSLLSVFAEKVGGGVSPLDHDTEKNVILYGAWNDVILEGASATIDDILAEIRNNHVRVLYIAGHCKDNKILLNNEVIDFHVMKNLLSVSVRGGSQTIEAVIFSCCDTDDWATLLLSNGVKVVVTSNRHMYDKEISSYMAGVFKALANGSTMKEARESAGATNPARTHNSMRIRGNHHWRW